MAEIFYDKDADLNLLKDKTIAVIGFGSQGHAHALNLHESGCRVVVGLRADSSSRAEAEKHGVKVFEPAEAARMADIVMFLVPDELQPQIYAEHIEPNLEAGNAVINYAPPKTCRIKLLLMEKLISSGTLWWKIFLAI